MKSVLQRVQTAAVKVNDKVVGQISAGWLCLVGITHSDTAIDSHKLAERILKLRAFEDPQDATKRASILDLEGSILVVSNFTLYAQCKKGTKPSFSEAAPSESAFTVYTEFLSRLKATPLNIQKGVFGEEMLIESVAHGPFTLILES